MTASPFASWPISEVVARLIEVRIADWISSILTQGGVRQASWQRIGGESPPWGKD